MPNAGWSLVRVVLAAAALLSVAAAPALAQFDTPAGTDIKEKITGNLQSAEGAPSPEPGDGIGAFFQDKICGKFVFSGTTTSREFAIVIFGDDPATTLVEGAKSGAAVQFRFYDSSSNQTRTDVRVENTAGEAFNYKYAGIDVPTLPVDLPGLDLTPTRNLNLRVGVVTGGGGGGGTDDPVNKFDVDGNGKVETDDAAMVLRIVTGASRGLSEDVLSRADVTGDGKVDTGDAIEIMRNRP